MTKQSTFERLGGIAAPMEKSAAALLRAAGSGLRAAGAGLARATSRLPKNHGIPNQFVGAVEDALATNSRLIGRRGLGMINSVDDVTRRNPNLRYMGSAEARLPGAKQHGVGVVDYFQAGVDDVGTAGGRQMSPMVMRQRYRTGYDPSGKAIYDKANVDVIKQPMYVSTGTGSGASSAGRWVPFSEMHAPANAAADVKRLHAANPRLAARLPVAPVIPGTSGNGSWLGKHVNMVDAQGNLIREDIVAPGLGRWSKEALPPHLEAAQEVLNRFYGLNKTAHTKSADVFLAVGDLLRTLRAQRETYRKRKAAREPVKSASRLSGLIRAGKLGVDSLKRIGVSPGQVERMAEIGTRQVANQTRKQWLREWRFPVREMREANQPSAAWRTASDAYSTGNPYHVNQRLKNVTGLDMRSPKMTYPPGFEAMVSGLPTTAPALKPRWRPSLPERARTPHVKSPPTSGLWGESNRGLQADGAYHADSGEVWAHALGTPTSRHELGHWKQHALGAAQTPSARTQLTSSSLSNWLALRRANPGIAQKIAESAGDAMEFQGHILATSGNGRGAQRLRQATDPANIPDWSRVKAPLQELSSSLLAHPVTAGRPALRSSVEHLVRNYGMPTIKSAAITPFEKLAKYRRLDHARPNPSQAQIASQNFKMGHVDFHGLDLTIENEKGSVRRGTTKEGKKWESVLTCPYGYIRSAAGGKSGERVRPKARDGDHIDVFVGPNKSSELVVAIDQYLDGKYDESKFLLGCDSQDEGVQLYRSNYQRGWPDMPASTCTFAQFKEWLKNGDHKKPFAGQMVKAASRFG